MKKVITALLVAVLALVGSSQASSVAGGARAAAAVTPQGAAGGLMGDVNCSGGVDTVDALQILRLTAGLTTNANCMDTAGDVDCSGDVNSVDALRVLRYVAGLSNQAVSGCTAIGDPIGGGPSSGDLIDQALANHTIDEQTALVYKVYAEFGDSRLPSQYRGDDSLTEDSDGARLAALRFDSLSPDEQAKVAPYLLPPSAPGSWLNQPALSQAPTAAQRADQPVAITWKIYPAVDGKVKFWAQDRYPGDDAKAQALADAMTGKIWPSILGLMGADHAPLGDEGLPNNGGDGALDIYLVHISDYGLALPADPKNDCELVPTYLLVNSDRPLGSETSPGMLQTVAHEFFHAVQSTFHLSTHCWWPEYAWATEGTATWVEDYVYPQAQSEQAYARFEMGEPALSLDSLAGLHRYGTYLVALYMARQLENPALVKSLWENFAKNTSFAALDKVLPGGLTDKWPDFALRDWNRPPVDNFKQADNLQLGATPSDETTLYDGGVSIRDTVGYLGATYYHYKFADEARAAKFTNFSLPANVKISALVNIGGQWQNVQDWTSEKKKSFCRDIPGQDIQELVLIVSNTDWQGKKPVTLDGPVVQAYTTGCKAWEGWIDAKYRYYDTTFSTHLDDVRFEVTPETKDLSTQTYAWTESSPIVWTVSGTWPGGCTPSGQLTINGPGGQGPPNWSGGFLEINRTKLTYKGIAHGFVDGATFTLTCPAGTSQQVWAGMTMWNTDLTTMRPMADDGTVIEGEYTDPAVAYGGTWKWHLAPAP